MKRFLFKFLLFLTYPIRLAVRYELNLKADKILKQTDYMQRVSGSLKTGDFINKNLSQSFAANNKFELIDYALKIADTKAKLILEFGVFSGETINFISNKVNRNVFGFDSFQGLPGKWREGFDKGFFSVKELPKVNKNCVLIKGWFESSIPSFLPEHPEDIGFLHVDCDMYSSTKTIFDMMGPKIKRGTVIVFDDYFNYDSWLEGEHKAWTEFVESNSVKFEYLGYVINSEQIAVIIK
jgi:hypothetical protein